MWVQLYGQSINMNNVSRFWLEQEQSDDNSIIPTLKIQLTNHGPHEWIEFEIHATGNSDIGSLELAKTVLHELRTILDQQILL
ncbi:MAG: hypothetical protein HQM12_06665 [SAR324 cluster bacterium]|nr:hypothetical protein [SAR324 cluster bacterium]MBF0351345.1 hypothetical protein [SAR324 cluster bacterium]